MVVPVLFKPRVSMGSYYAELATKASRNLRALNARHDPDVVKSACQSVCTADPVAVQQVLAGNVRAINRLIGGVLKTLPGTDPKVAHAQLTLCLDSSISGAAVS
jgi:Asp-tRNA(Asn)/Glu-tRNA(Gln) amidotransferase B subunit